MIDSRRLQGRLLQVSDGSIVVRLRSPTSGASLAETDVRIPVSQLMRVEGLVELEVREDFARDFIGPNTMRVELLEETKPKAEVTLAQGRAKVRELLSRYHPDVSRAAFFSANEIAADLNLLAESLRMINSSKEN